MNRKMIGALSASVSIAALGLNVARFDGNDPVLAEINREIKQYGTDMKSLKDSMSKDLADVRKLAEETKGAIGPEIKAQIEALSASVATKQSALEASTKSMQEQMDKLDVALQRLPTGGNSSDAEKKARDEAYAFEETMLSLKGQLNPANRPDIDKIDHAGYALWAKGYDPYLRYGDRHPLVDQKALSVGSNPDGGYLTPTARSARIIQKIFESSPMRGLASIETIGTSELEIPVDIDELDTGWVGETQTRSETGTPQVGVQKIPVHEIYAKPKATQKFLEDASINVEAWLAGKVADKFGRTEATAFISGNGINKPRGILTYTAGSAGARGTIAQYASLAATGITADAIVKLPFYLKQAYLAGASWLMKRSTVMEVMLLKDGQGQYLWRPSMTVGAPSVLGGYEVNMADDMPAVAASALPIAFGNWRQAYTIVDRLGITTLRDPYSAKPFVEFYSRKRVGGDVTDFEALALMVVSAA